MYSVSPRIMRDVAKSLTFSALKEGEQADYSLTRTSVEIPLGVATIVTADGKTKPIQKAKAGDIITLEPTVTMEVDRRIVHVEAHDLLYKHGRLTMKRIYEHGDKAFVPTTWECTTDLDLKKLPYLFKVYVVEGLVR